MLRASSLFGAGDRPPGPAAGVVAVGFAIPFLPQPVRMNPLRPRPLVPLLALIVLASGGYLGWRGLAHDAQASPSQALPVAPASNPKEAAPAPMQSQGPALVAEAKPTEDGWLMPDGKRFPLLNHVPQAPQFAWPSNRPFSPIVGKKTDTQGDEWYVHADGSLSTMQMKWRKDLGRYDGTATTINPSDVMPIPDDELPPSAR